MKKILLSLCILYKGVFAQQVAYQDIVYDNNIKTVQLYNSLNEQSTPIITLNNNESLLLQFDELSTNPKTYAYTIEHCDAQWRPSALNPMVYIDGFFEDTILDYSFSIATFARYIHYEATFPNTNIRPKISGNYVLKVFPRDMPESPIFIRRFYVVEYATEVDFSISPAEIESRKSDQKPNLKINLNTSAINNPNQDVNAYIVQNRRPEHTLNLSHPLYSNNQSLLFTDVNTASFPGDNEFRKLDVRIFNTPSKLKNDSLQRHIARPDFVKSQNAYESIPDMDGLFYIRHPENRNSKIYADYALVTFSLAAPKTSSNQALYLVGKFNDWRIAPENQLKYIDDIQGYQISLILKQGVYDYRYVLGNAYQQYIVDSSIIDGSFFETQNTYEVFIYGKKQNETWQSLIGYKIYNDKRP